MDYTIIPFVLLSVYLPVSPHLVNLSPLANKTRVDPLLKKKIKN